MRQFTIKRNRHYCQYWWTKFFKPRWRHRKWTVTFIISNDCWWNPPRSEDDRDINKLYGVGFGFNHHKNSWGIGWIPDFEKENWFNIYAYCYNRDGHVFKLIGGIKADRPYSVSVESIRDKYWFTCLDLGAFIDIPNINKDYKLQFDLYPYHEGDNKSPKEETFFIDFNAL